MRKIKSMFICITILQYSCLNSSHDQNRLWKYPILQSEPVTEELHGNLIIDEFRILEELEDHRVKKWFSEQKKFYSSIIQNISGRSTLEKELEENLNLKKIWVGVPRTANDRIFIHKYDYENKTEKLLIKESIDAPEVEIYSTSNTISYIEPSYNGNYLAFGEYNDGDEQANIFVYDVEQKNLLQDYIPRAMYGNPQWLPDGSGFFYSQLKELASEKDKKTRYEDTIVKFHAIGSDPETDRKIFSREINKDLPLEKIDFHFLFTYPNSNKVLMAVYHGSENYANLYWTFLKDLFTEPVEKINWNKLSTEKDKVEGFALIGDQLITLNYRTNTFGVIEKMNLRSPLQRNIIYENDSILLKSLMQNQSGIFFMGKVGTKSKLMKMDIENESIEEIPLPHNASISLKTGWKVYSHSDGLFLSLESWKMPKSIYYYDPGSKELIKTQIGEELHYPEFDEIVVKNLEVISHDGTKVPLTVVHNKNLKLDGQNPTILYAYGSHGTSINPHFESNKLLWYKKGGVYAVAHVRGGGEKGENWHMQGFKETKPNSWKDFISCAKFLIDNGYTSSKKLAAEGESAGGITIGRAITENPSLFKAALISMGVTNILRFENTENTVNISEFGTVADSLDFYHIYNMDVYHHISETAKYPSILFTTAMNDVRVAPWQPAKATAKFQQVSTGENIVLLKVSEGGHFGSSDYILDKYAFLFWQLGYPDFRLKNDFIK